MESAEDNYFDKVNSEIPTVVWKKSITVVNKYTEGMIEVESKAEVKDDQQEKPGDQPTVFWIQISCA